MAVIGSADELLARASSRTEVRPGDGKAGARYERVLVDGEPYFVKRLSPASDWIMRVTGDHVHRPFLAWQGGIMARSPASIDHTVVAMQVSGAGDDAVLTMVMRDAGAFLVPEGDAVVPASQHAGFIEHMADLSCAFWGWADDIGLTTMSQRIRFFAPDNIAGELLAADVPAPIAAADAGWRALPGRSPVLSGLASLLHDRPVLITGPLADTPRTFLHGDWKMGNLGTHPDGRTILLDWAYPGSGPACWDLCWYLALNRARLPESKEAAIDRFRAALEARGVATGSWWDAQLDLCLIAIMATFGWEKALGGGDELSWWESRVTDAAARQGIGVPGTAG
jgi:hypothetical protein